MLEWISPCGWQLLTYTNMLKPLSNGGTTFQNLIRFTKVSVRKELYQHSIYNELFNNDLLQAREKLSSEFANSSLITAFIIRFLESIMYRLATSEISIL